MIDVPVTRGRTASTKSRQAAQRSQAICLAAAVGSLFALLGCVPGPGEPPGTSGRVVWAVPGGGWMSQAIVNGASVFFASRTHEVLGIDRESGAVRWTQNTGIGGGLTGGWGLVQTADVVVLTDRSLHAFSRATGAKRWVFQPEDGDAPGLTTIAADSATVYAPSLNNRAYAVDGLSGVLRWSIQLPGDSLHGSFHPTVKDGVVFFGTKRFGIPTSGSFVALDAATGTIRWIYNFTPGYPGALYGCLGEAVFHDDNVIVDAEDGRIYAFNRQTGAVQWIAPRVHSIPTDPGGGGYGDNRTLVVAGDILVAGSNSGVLVGIDARTGTERWRHGGRYITPQGTPFATDGPTVYITDSGGELYAIEANTGVIRWSLGRASSAGGDALFASPPVVAGDRLYVGGRSAYYALRRN